MGTPDIVCSIRADEITLSPLHSAGKTRSILVCLAISTVYGVSRDKIRNGCYEVKEIKHLYADQFKNKRLCKNSLDLNIAFSFNFAQIKTRGTTA